MSIYMRAYDYLMWYVIVDGHFVLMRKIRGSEELEPKQRSELTNGEVKKIQINFKAIITLHYALNPMKFNKISTCKTTKEICDKLRVTYKGTTQVKESKIALISNQYEMFKMQVNESINSWFYRYTTIINQLN